MKAAHTGRVRLGIRAGWPPKRGSPAGRSLLAETAGLLHDAGRFEQYERYRTFRDGESEHHGRLAVQVIRTHGLLQDIPAASSGVSSWGRSPTTTKRACGRSPTRPRCSC